jgi:hypothetical protein
VRASTARRSCSLSAAQAGCKESGGVDEADAGIDGDEDEEGCDDTGEEPDAGARGVAAAAMLDGCEAQQLNQDESTSAAADGMWRRQEDACTLQHDRLSTDSFAPYSCPPPSAPHVVTSSASCQCRPCCPFFPMTNALMLGLLRPAA